MTDTQTIGRMTQTERESVRREMRALENVLDLMSARDCDRRWHPEREAYLRIEGRRHTLFARLFND